MSGKRQHYIPQFLQRGFAFGGSSKSPQAWVYPKNRETYRSGINNIGIEAFFYTENATAEADDLITQRETLYAPLVEKLRNAVPGPVFDPLISEFIASLETRTKNIRECFLQTSNTLTSQLFEFICDPTKLTAYLKRRLQKDSQFSRGLIEREILKYDIPRALAPEVVAHFQALLPALIEQQQIKFPMDLEYFRLTLTREITKAAKLGHLRAISNPALLENRGCRYVQFNYTLADLTEQTLILGDSLVIFQVDGPRRFKAFLDKDDKLIATFLPLGPHRVLIGSNDAYQPQKSRTEHDICKMFD